MNKINAVAIQRPWEIWQNVSSTLSASKSLEFAAGLDDVQAQCVLAAEALGSGLCIVRKR